MPSAWRCWRTASERELLSASKTFARSPRLAWSRERGRSLAASIPVAVWLGALVLVSAAVRFALSLGHPGPFIFQDELLYSELAKSFAATGHFAVRDVPTLAGVGPIYPALLSPAYALFDSLPHAYAAAKAINALVMSLAAVPVYLLARRLVEPTAALFAAALTLAVPWLTYTSLIMTENAFYPVFLFWVLALVLALERPTLLRQLAMLVLLGATYEVRPQAVALLPALVTALVLAIGLDAWLTEQRPRRRALLSGALAFWPTWLALALGTLFFFVVEIGLRGRSVSATLLGGYAPLGAVDYSPGAVARWFVWQVGELDAVTAVFPFAAFFVLLIAACRREESTPALRAFAAAAFASTFWLLLEVAMFESSPYSQRMQERSLFCLVPIFLVALVAWARRGLARPWPATAVAAVLAAGLTGVVPYTRFLNGNTINDSFGLLPIMRLQQRFLIDLSWIDVGIVLAATAAAMIFVILPRRWALVAPALVLVYFAVANRSVEAFTKGTSEGSRYGGIQGDADWIDRAVGRNAQVAALFTNNLNYVTLWENEFFNRSVGPVYNFIGPPDGLPQQTVAPDPKTGTLKVVGGPVVRSQYVLADTTLFVRGSTVATDPGVGMALYRVDGPVRLAGRIDGLFSDSWSGPTAVYTRYACRGGRLGVALMDDPLVHPGPVTVVASSDGRTLGRAVLNPTRRDRPFVKVFRFPLVGEGGQCGVQFTISPTAVADQALHNGDQRALGLRFSRIAYEP